MNVSELFSSGTFIFFSNGFLGYENLVKAYEKAKRVLEKDQNLPRSLIKILAQLDDFVNQV